MRPAITGGWPSSARRYHHGSISAASPCARIWAPQRASSAVWAAVLPYVQNDPPAQILVDHQGEDHDGGMFDDPDDDTAWEKLKFGVQEAAWAWGPALLQYNPPALFYQGVAGAAEAGAEAVRKPLEEAARFGKYLITGAAVTGAAAVLLFVYNRSKAPTSERTDNDRVIDVDAVEVP